MSLLDDIRRVYPVIVKCKNCDVLNTVKIKKGISMEDFFSKMGATCHNCGCLISFSKIKVKYNQEIIGE